MQGTTFVAGEVLAKHDENYMPPEVAKSLKENNRASAEKVGVSPDSKLYQPAEPIKDSQVITQ